jgi:hypothetical protein
MAPHDLPASAESPFSTRAFHAVYLIAVAVGMAGWTYFLGSCVLGLFGY